ncbi:nuclear transport factor 2 [Strongylocentrotus purpuratus]|uniref:Nuclear transport factor 2 n=1 Tax=Strongylocentrotus purpuratus TaxID=7668 RepID=A0A7M7N7Y4_STRPU|nr:nuclear transport factor 2 [Strongylocentrotus purpuratus]|eukprot:XP_797612.1 PREDICTED: nuclear transport factor 2 [Strongylocentrotus purpuratus]
MEVASHFVKHYYNLFDTDRTQLGGLYTNESKLSFEGQEFQGPEAICTKLVSLPFKTVAHHITTVDCQITIDNKLLIAVLGQLKTDDDPPHSFFQTFSLADRNGSLVIMNDIFRLVIHHVA